MTIDMITQRTRSRLTLLAALAVAAFIAGRVIWIKCVKYEILPRNLGVVKEGTIYRSGQHSGRVLRQLCAELHLRTIIDLGGREWENPRTQAEQRIAQEMGVTRYAFGLPGDGTGDPDKWAAVVQVMADPANHPVLVHCATGAQRTTTATLLYQHIVDGKAIREVYPDCFNYKHKPDEWEIVAYLADHVGQIELAVQTNQPTHQGDAATISELARTYRVSPSG